MSGDRFSRGDMRDFHEDTENSQLRIFQKGGRSKHQSLKISKEGLFGAVGDSRSRSLLLGPGGYLNYGCPCLLSYGVSPRFLAFVSWCGCE